MHHPDFRVGGKIFATLAYPDDSWGMVKLTPEQQYNFVSTYPDVFKSVNGAWGRQGCTNVHLPKATVAALRPAMKLAWENARSTKPIKRPAATKSRSARARPL